MALDAFLDHVRMTGRDFEVARAPWAAASRNDDGTWRLDRTRILEAVAKGRPVARTREFLDRRTGVLLPAEVDAFLADCESRAGAPHRDEIARLYECRDRATADQVASDPRTGRHCLRAGERTLVVPADSEGAFTRSLRNVGFGIAARGDDASEDPRPLARADERGS